PVPFLLLLLLGSVVQASTSLTLEEAAARNPPEYSPLYEGRIATVSGQISVRPVRITNYVHLAIQERGYGLILEGSGAIFDRFSPGDWVEAHGRIAQRAGLVVLAVSKISTASAGAPPVAVPLTPTQVQNMDRLGQFRGPQ